MSNPDSFNTFNNCVLEGPLQQEAFRREGDLELTFRQIQDFLLEEQPHAVVPGPGAIQDHADALLWQFLRMQRLRREDAQETQSQ